LEEQHSSTLKAQQRPELRHSRHLDYHRPLTLSHASAALVDTAAKETGQEAESRAWDELRLLIQSEGCAENVLKALDPVFPPSRRAKPFTKRRRATNAGIVLDTCQTAISLFYWGNSN